MPSTTENASPPPVGTLHHVEIWVPDLSRATTEWGWLLESLGYTLHQTWDKGRSWRLGHTYIVFEQSPALTHHQHDRCAPGLNHLAFHVPTADEVEALTEKALNTGWSLLFPDRHPHAGGAHQHAAYLENTDHFEIELVATQQAPAVRESH